MVSQDRHAGCEQLDGESDDGLYANSGKLGVDELLMTEGSRASRRKRPRAGSAPAASRYAARARPVGFCGSAARGALVSTCYFTLERATV
jgi:hypothetical protein